MVIRLEGVAKTYHDRAILGPVTLEIPARSTLAVVGPSGSGKSTLLRIVVGLVVPDAGRVYVAEEPLTRQTARILRRRIGYVIQDGGLFPHLTARANVTLMAEHLDWSAERTRARVQELAELTQLGDDVLARYPAQTSGGERQRVALMRALMLDPDVLLMDEPLGALDPMTRVRLQDDLRRIVQRLQKTVLLVTHDMPEAMRLGDTIALMRKGELVQRGTYQELLDAPAEPFVTEFLAAQRTSVDSGRTG
jgi:osmoprotectant transport system ATP-binding protein